MLRQGARGEGIAYSLSTMHFIFTPLCGSAVVFVPPWLIHCVLFCLPASTCCLHFFLLLSILSPLLHRCLPFVPAFLLDWLPNCLPSFLPICQPACLRSVQSVCLSVGCVPARLPPFQVVSYTSSLPTCLSVYLLVFLLICLPVYLSVSAACVFPPVGCIGLLSSLRYRTYPSSWLTL